jgi:hypothetical protein
MFTHAQTSSLFSEFFSRFVCNSSGVYCITNKQRNAQLLFLGTAILMFLFALIVKTN